MNPDIYSKLVNIRRVARELRNSSTDSRQTVLASLAKLLRARSTAIEVANKLDLDALDSSSNSSFRDRLTLTQERIALMADSLDKVRALADPVGQIVDKRTLANGLNLRRVRGPLGVILMIFEARPNVITEAFSLALKSGNALIMRGGSESIHSSKLIYSLVYEALGQAGLPKECFWGITDPDRALTQSLMKQDRYIDVLVPRGGESLIEYVKQNATMPIIKNDRGLCHVYLHEDADANMSIDIVRNAKTSRPGVCNSMETLLVHEKQKMLIPKIHDTLQSANVQWYGCSETLKLLAERPGVLEATSENFATEYLDFKLNCKIVASLDDAIEHIETYGSRHSECIVTASESAARKFQTSVDAAVVYWNASTRFTDGYEFGLGGELGISTQKLHVRGPVGLNELTSLRWIADGTGQIR